MDMGHTERMLMADNDPQAALEFRAVAEAEMDLRQRAVELYEVVGDPVPDRAREMLAKATLELKQLNRVVLRHAARRMDNAKRAEGVDSEMESAVIMFDIENPVALAA